MLRLSEKLMFVAVMLLPLAATAITRADEPIDPAKVLPEGTLLYLAHYGSEQTASAAKSTAIGKMSADPQFDRFFDMAGIAIDEAVNSHVKEPAMLDVYKTATHIASALWRRPVALAVIDAGMSEKGLFVHAALLVHAGSHGKALLSDVNKLVTVNDEIATQPISIAGCELQQVMVPVSGGVYYGLLDDYFVVAVGSKTVEQIAARVKGEKKTCLAINQQFSQARKKIGGSIANVSVTGFINVADAAKKLRTIIPGVEMALTTMELGHVRSICYEQFYRDRGCQSGLYIQNDPTGEDAGESDGILLEVKDDDIALIPRDASWGMVAKHDSAKVAANVMRAIQKLDAIQQGKISQGIERAEKELGFSIQDDLLAQLGDTVVFYDAPENGGFIFTGATIILRPSDPAKLATNVGKIVATIAKFVGTDHLDAKILKHGETTITFANAMGAPVPVAPAWAVKDNYLIIAFYPQMVAAALDRIESKQMRDTSLLVNKDFIAARKVLGSTSDSLVYIDTKASVGTLYTILLPLAQMGAAAGQGEGVHIDISALPTRDAFTRHLFPDVSITRRDDTGILHASYGPFPVSIGPAGLVAGGAMGVSVLLPALSRARELSKRTVCASNLRGIGMAMYIHAQDSNQFPDNFQQLIDSQNSTPRQFYCPSSNSKEGDLKACYLYIRGQGPADDPNNVLVYEKRANHGDEGGNVLFVDARVEFVKPYSRVEKLVKETRKRLAEKKAKTEKGQDDDKKD